MIPGQITGAESGHDDTSTASSSEMSAYLCQHEHRINYYTRRRRTMLLVVVIIIIVVGI